MLHDVDKLGSQRHNPQPNYSDVVLAESVQAHGTTSVNYTTDAVPDINAHNGHFYIVKSDTFKYNSQINTVNPGAGKFGVTEILLGTIPHNLGYTPTVIAYYNQANGWQRLPYDSVTTIVSTVWWFNFTVQVDSTNVYFYFRSMNLNGATGIGAGVSFRYYLLRQTSR